MIAGPLSNNEPSLEFRELLKTLTDQATNLVKTYEKIMKMGLEEGFNEKQIQGFVKDHLKDIKTRHELYYIFNKEKINQQSSQSYQDKKALINAQIAGKKDTEESSTPTDYNIQVTNKAKIIDVEPQNMVEKSKLDNLEITDSFGHPVPDENIPKAIRNMIKTLEDSGFDTEKAITVIKGNPAQVLYQLEAYKQQNIREMLIILQKVS
ncbi:MAG TPA: hypothetical protein VF220_01495 [Nitrososphaeraceae archaeon]